MEIELLPEGALQAASTLAAALLARPEHAGMNVTDAKVMASFFAAALHAVLAGVARIEQPD